MGGRNVEELDLDLEGLELELNLDDLDFDNLDLPDFSSILEGLDL